MILLCLFYLLLSLIFLVLDPLGNVPMFLFVLQNIPPERRKAIIIRELLFALVILMIFLFTGRYILDALHVTESSLGIAGGVILMLSLSGWFSAAQAKFSKLNWKASL